MPYRLLADLVVLVHVGFVLFVALGGVAVLRWPGLAWAHLPAVVWGALIEIVGWVCPLTPLEVALRRLAGGAGYREGFLSHYVSAFLYPPGLTRGAQTILGALVLATNAVVYAEVVRRRRAARALG